MAAPADHDVVELELPTRAEVVSVARLVVGGVAAGDPLFDEERRADLRLAVSEATTNAIQAQRRVERRQGHPGPPVLLRCTLREGIVEVRVRDHGGGFDPDALPAHPAVTDPARLDYEGGLGIPLLRMLADRVEFVPVEGGTEVQMWFLPRPAGYPAVLDHRGSEGPAGR